MIAIEIKTKSQVKSSCLFQKRTIFYIKIVMTDGGATRSEHLTVKERFSTFFITAAAVNLVVSASAWPSLIKRGGTNTDNTFAFLAYMYLRYSLISDIISPISPRENRTAAAYKIAAFV